MRKKIHLVTARGYARGLMIKVAQESFDFERLAALLLELDGIHNKAAPKRFPLYSLEKRREDIRKIFEQGYLFYAEQGLQIIGFASVIKRKEILMIEHLYVQPEFRRKQVASKIIDKIVEQFPSREIFASVYAFNSEAVKFYDKRFELSSLVFRKSKEASKGKG